MCGQWHKDHVSYSTPLRSSPHEIRILFIRNAAEAVLGKEVVDGFHEEGLRRSVLLDSEQFELLCGFGDDMRGNKLPTLPAFGSCRDAERSCLLHGRRGGADVFFLRGECQWCTFSHRSLNHVCVLICLHVFALARLRVCLLTRLRVCNSRVFVNHAKSVS